MLFFYLFSHVIYCSMKILPILLSLFFLTPVFAERPATRKEHPPIKREHPSHPREDIREHRKGQDQKDKKSVKKHHKRKKIDKKN